MLEQIRDQHDRMKQLFHDLEQALTSVSVDRLAVLSRIDELIALFEEHFRCEEQFMASFEYPQLSGHRWQHEVLFADLLNIRAAVSDGTDVAPLDILHKLRNIVIDHMTEADTEMIDYYNRRTVEDDLAKVLPAAAEDRKAG